MTLTPSVDAGLKALFDDYAAQLPAKIKETDELWARVASGEGGEAVQSLHRALHSLAGSAETFGYSRLGRSAKALELAIAALLDGDTPLRGGIEPLAPLLDDLKHAAGVPDSPASEGTDG